MVISNSSRRLLDGHIVGRAVSVDRQLADKSWEVSVDDDMGFALDCLCGDPDRAIEIVVLSGQLSCPQCRAVPPVLDDDWCWNCKMLVL